VTLYHADVTVPAGTSEGAPVEVDLTIEDEVITRIAVTFPLGCNGEVYLAIFYGPYQLFPRPDGAALHDSGRRVEARMFWECPERKTTLTIRAWAPHAEYDHTLMVDVEALPRRIAQPWGALDRLTSLLRRIRLMG